MPQIHPTAIVDSQAELSCDAVIGAYSLIEGPVHIGTRTTILPYTHVQGRTTIGENCTIGPAAYVGLPAQHLKADPAVGQLRIGDRVIIRETATLHRSTRAGEEHATRVGDDCFLMGGVHVAHDCVLANGVIAANAALLGGHCEVGEKAFLGGGCTIHQHVRIGRLAMIAGNEAFTHDALPFAAVRYGYMKGYNAIGCKRAGMSREVIHALRGAFYVLKHNRNQASVIVELEKEFGAIAEVREIIDFIHSSKRGILPSSVRRWRDDEN